MAGETYGVRQRDLAEKYSDEQIVEVLWKEPVACKGKCNTILKNFTKFRNSFYYSFYPLNCPVPVLILSLSHDTPNYYKLNFQG